MIGLEDAAADPWFWLPATLLFAFVLGPLLAASFYGPMQPRPKRPST